MEDKYKKLIMVTSANNNKFYEMKNNDNGTFTVEYGRVGAKAQTSTYPISQWNKKYNEKIKKGYKDQTELFVTEIVDEAKNESSKTVDNKRDPKVISMVNKLQGWANKSISVNYEVSSEQVTQKQIDKAQSVIDDLVAFNLTESNINSFNNILLDFFSIVPRKMKNVKSNLIDTKLSGNKLQETKNNIISNEQDTLDVMAGQVQLNTNTKSSTETDQKSNEINDIVKSSGLEFEVVNDSSIIDMVKGMMQNNAHKLKSVYKVVNLHTQKNFDDHVKNAKDKTTKLYWHGSKNENWWSIITTGLKIRPSNAVHTGSMFGDGIYYASKFQKSFGYSSGRNSYWARGNSNEATLAIYDVHVGKQKLIKKHDSSCYSLNYNKIQKEGFDSVFAQGGIDLINDEFIVYNSNQCTIKYLILVEA